MASPDNPQPPPPPAPVAPVPGENVIVVPGLDSIEGRVADCRRNDAQSAAPVPQVASTAQTVSTGQSATTRSTDGTLQFNWQHHADGMRRVVVDYLRDGEWQQAIDFTAAPALAR